MNTIHVNSKYTVSGGIWLRVGPVVGHAIAGPSLLYTYLRDRIGLKQLTKTLTEYVLQRRLQNIASSRAGDTVRAVDVRPREPLTIRVHGHA